MKTILLILNFAVVTLSYGQYNDVNSSPELETAKVTEESQSFDEVATDKKNNSFIGMYAGWRNRNAGVTLTVREDMTFTMHIQKHNGVDLAEGSWKQVDDRLLMSTRALSPEEMTQMEADAIHWIDFEEMPVVLKGNKLVALSNKHWKLRKIVKCTVEG